jgi:tRNA synthetases class II (D, K and N)
MFAQREQHDKLASSGPPSSPRRGDRSARAGEREARVLVKWSIDLQSEHERYLIEKHAEKPVIVMNYPKAIKAFYCG